MEFDCSIATTICFFTHDSTIDDVSEKCHNKSEINGVFTIESRVKEDSGLQACNVGYAMEIFANLVDLRVLIG